MKLVYDGLDEFPDGSHKLKLFNDAGQQIFVCEARNDSVGDNAWRPDAGCPPGTYDLGAPEFNNVNVPSTPDNDWIGEGEIFIPVNDVPGHSRIGIHGGGTCVTFNSDQDALLARQGWCPTLNCFRLQNEDLEELARLLPAGGATFVVRQSV